jgi:RND family efflux transporter MFP subunit
VRARVETELGFRTGGKVVERLVDVGAAVRSGQILARLDLTDYDLAVQSALDQQRAASVEAEQTASDEARMGRLLNEGSVGAADHERQKARADAAAARLDQATRSLVLARNQQSYATLRAPYDGVVTARMLEVGQVVAAGQAVFALARDGEREIVAEVPETLIPGLRDREASATPWQGRGAAIPLTLREMAPMASNGAGTYRVRYALATATGRMHAAPMLGATMQLHLKGDAGEAGVELPAAALVKAHDAPGVWVVEGSGTVRFQPVTVQGFSAAGVRVEGITDGTRVITVGAQKLDATMKVTPVERRAEATQMVTAVRP